MRVNHQANHGKVTPGHISMVIGPMVCCQAGSAQVVQQASVHSSEGGTETLLPLCERALRDKCFSILKELTEVHHQEWSLRLNLTEHGETHQVRTWRGLTD